MITTDELREETEAAVGESGHENEISSQHPDRSMGPTSNLWASNQQTTVLPPRALPSEAARRLQKLLESLANTPSTPSTSFEFDLTSGEDDPFPDPETNDPFAVPFPIGETLAQTDKPHVEIVNGLDSPEPVPKPITIDDYVDPEQSEGTWTTGVEEQTETTAQPEESEEGTTEKQSGYFGWIG